MASIQIRNVPEQLHERFKLRAAQCGLTLSDYLLDELRVVADRSRINNRIAAVDTPPTTCEPSSVAPTVWEQRQG